MRPLPLVLLALTLALALPATAEADWQYTRWGMSPEQVVAASAGQATLLPPAQRSSVPPMVTAVTGSFQDGKLALQTAFAFDKAGLRCVVYGVDDNDDNAAFEAALLARLGPPKRSDGLPAIGLRTFTWTTATDQIEGNFHKDSAAFAMHCRK